jgi:large subunit ribosomal protein L10
MPSQEKKEKVKEIKKWFDGAKSVLVLHYSGLKVSEANELRGIIGKNDAELRVLKNTLTKIALEGSPYEQLVELLQGPVAVVFAADDPTQVARALRDFSRGRGQFYLLGGLVKERLLNGKQVEAIATLPPREVLLGQLVGVLQAPLARIVWAVAAPPRKMLGLLQALSDKKAEAQPAEALEAEAPAAVEEPEATSGREAAAREPEAAPEPESEATGEAEGEAGAGEPATPAGEADTGEPPAEA